MIQSYRIDVYGIVQGVGFRWFTQQTANKYHLVGWVCNNSNGSVEMRVQGQETNVKAFIEAINQGPGYYSRVDKVLKHAVAPFESNNFAIK
ncbi:acylphosphatase [Leuconostoc gasicomitatum]|uniref:acylphosphatase n=1 Tax=Leuconostoc gasicomitatum TaxID=115778 RepID=UPI0007E12A3E|nr:acylphosphatase [Leuconostoc gasicomitatum]MBR2277076.1 acylphosphatase [Leuconostoc sp.]MBZ5944428.1 acylphosphatase [Leuconostoc gasicomitatum]MBZ5945265.1 acylphosphatase [Leuconostoc gasicomitatum]MBZ5946974.1 acylphosphatase [Leuconostoc gasicomitatum]MBZ5950362.1 acylphosphatase [Leuconostoc gasicomitatum]